MAACAWWRVRAPEPLSQQQLQEHHVEPLIELEADVAEVRHLADKYGLEDNDKLLDDVLSRAKA